MIRGLVVMLSVAIFGAAKLPMEQDIAGEHRALRFGVVDFNLDLREQLGQLGFVAALSGFRSLVADALFIQAHGAWERTEWSRVLRLFRQVTTLQPRALLFWDTAAWHMGWNASTAALDDRHQPRLALRIKAQREYFALARDFLERGIGNNPDRPQLYEALARLYRDKYNDHEKAAHFFGEAARRPGAPSYVRRFAAYELAQCPGHERHAYEQLRALYDLGESERAPTLLRRLKELEIKLDIPADQRIADSSP